MLNVLVAVENGLWREELEAIFAKRKDVRLLHVEKDPKPSVEEHIDIIILGSSEKDKIDTLENLSCWKKRHPNSKFILVADDLAFSDILDTYKMGVFAFVDEHATCGQLLNAVDAARRGDLYVSCQVMKAALGRGSILSEIFGNTRCNLSGLRELSAREMEVLRLVARGMSNRSIAESLFISEKTVKNHLYSIYRKLGVNDRTEAAMFVVRGLLSHQNESFGP